MGVLTLLMILPVVALLAMQPIPIRHRVHRWISLGTIIAQLGLVLAALPGFFKARESSTWVWEDRFAWLRINLGEAGMLGVDFHLAADGIALVLVLLTLGVLLLGNLASWKIDHRSRAFFQLFLLLDAALIGVFCARDFFLFYLCYEFMLLPMFFLIGGWGGPNREFAALKFFIYTLSGSIFMLLVMIGLMLSIEVPDDASAQIVRSFNFDVLFQGAPPVKATGIFAPGALVLGLSGRAVGFWILFLAFAIKVPMVPLHTWLPDAHVEASTGISVVLAGVLLKVGGYGLIRIAWGAFPDQAVWFAPAIAFLGWFSMLYGALVAMAQTDFKRLVAYSSVSHMGFVLLGLASMQAVGFTGAVFQMFTHGWIAPMLFLLVGVLYDRVHDRDIENFQGLWTLMPRFTFFTLIAFFAGLGLPGLAAFVSEALVFAGAFQAASAGRLSWWLVGSSVTAILLSAIYFLRTFRQMFFGIFDAENTSSWRVNLKDLNAREYIMLIPPTVLIVLLGILPGLFLVFFQEDTTSLAQVVQSWLPSSPTPYFQP